MRSIIFGGKILTPHQELLGYSLVMEGGKIQSIQPGIPHTREALERIDAEGMWVTPGLIDIHMHGAMGYDFMDATAAAVQAIAEHCARHGVTSYLATTISSAPDLIQTAIDNFSGKPDTNNGARSLGVHIEGPYLDVKYRGAQPKRFLRDPEPQEYQRWFGSNFVKMVTVAPERPGAIEMIQQGRRIGVEFAVGHTSATYQQVIEAADHGLRHATHTFNGMPGLHHREPGPVGAVLSDDRIYAQVIADGIHLHPAVVKLAIRIKGIQRTILITDAVRAAGLPDGEYDLAGDIITVKGGVTRTQEGSLAGSTATLDVCLRNAMQFANLTFQEALIMATITPATSLGLSGTKGELVQGADADITLFDQNLRTRKTFVQGRLVYSN